MPTMDKMFGKVYSKQRQEKRQLIIFEVFQIVNSSFYINYISVKLLKILKNAFPVYSFHMFCAYLYLTAHCISSMLPVHILCSVNQNEIS